MTRGPKRKSLAERFWSQVEITPACWKWLGRPTKNGYSRICIGGRYGRSLYAHRVAFELLAGPISEDTELDHLCRNRACVNPAHLEPVTHRENVLRGIGPAAKNASKTHCPYGHPLTKGSHQRVCVQCRARIWQARKHRYRARAKEESPRG